MKNQLPNKSVFILKIAFAFLFFNVFLCANAEAQDSKKEQKLFSKGYIKNLQSFNITTDSLVNLLFFGKPNLNIISQNVIHNRLNFKYYANDYWTAALEFRNQLFTGEQLKINPQNFADNLNYDPAFFDLRFNIFENNASVLNTQIDRAWVEYQKKKVAVRIGRQRINWGLNLIWNPNDLFNVYNFLDFDYEERPGTDAVKFSYFPNFNSSFEMAFSPGKSMANDTTFAIEESIIAAKYGFNFKKYDYQILSSYFKNDIALGVGWAGNIKNGSFKGEANYYLPLNDTLQTTADSSNFIISISYDNITAKGFYYQISSIYNQRGTNESGLDAFVGLQNFNADPKNLYPFRYSFLISGSKNINPLSTINFACIYSPNANTLILAPSYNQSIAANWDLDFFVQTFFGELIHFSHLNSSVFMRMKYNF